MKAFDIINNQIKALLKQNRDNERVNIKELMKTKNEIKEMFKDIGSPQEEGIKDEQRRKSKINHR